ncbi:hypothetical protein PVAND_009419 [Polypedilum vanderplanki]|uniref:Mitochondrial carrier protein n=1 Tax=Polypedilum vanderplanki TaxID=319348 RepID=A0A9J6CCU3_POLVA|nr:hypothetical protein PVAND_009419 [Polypedilum vanderplanki]
MKLVYCDFLAGYFGGASAVFFAHPMDTIKTWQQVYKTKISTTMYNIIIRNNGLNGFYKGFYFPLLSNGTISALVFAVYGNVIRLFQNRCTSEIQQQNMLKVHMLIAGSAAGFSQAILSCPIEVVKIRLQTLGFIGKSWNCMRYIFQHEGVYGLYRGLVPMIFRDILPYAIYTVVYDYMYEAENGIAFVRTIRMQSEQQQRQQNIFALETEKVLTSFSALTASILSWLLITPFDVIKTVMQAETSPNIHKNMLESCALLVRAHKYRALFSGSYMIVAKSYATLCGYQYCLNKCQANAVKENEIKYE